MGNVVLLGIAMGMKGRNRGYGHRKGVATMEELSARTFQSLERFVGQLASRLVAPIKQPVAGGVRWRYEAETIPVLIIAKAVRATSAFHAAWLVLWLWSWS